MVCSGDVYSFQTTVDEVSFSPPGSSSFSAVNSPCIKEGRSSKKKKKTTKNCRFIQENNKKAFKTEKPFSRCNKVEERQTVGKCAKVKKRNCRKVPYWLWASFCSLWSGKLILSDGWDVSGRWFWRCCANLKQKIWHWNFFKKRYRDDHLNKHNRTEIRTHCTIFVNFCL